MSWSESLRVEIVEDFLEVGHAGQRLFNAFAYAEQQAKARESDPFRKQRRLLRRRKNKVAVNTYKKAWRAKRKAEGFKKT